MPASHQEVAWVLDENELRQETTRLGFSPEITECLQQTRATLTGLSDTIEKLAHYLDACRRGATTAIPDSENPMLPAIAVLAGFRSARTLYEQREIPESVIDRTLADFEVQLYTYREAHGRFGLNALRWLGNHVNARIFALGRLQYVFAPQGLRFDIYQSQRCGEIVALAEPGSGYTAEGWLRSDATSRQTQRQDTSTHFVGNPANPASGAILPIDLALPREEFILVSTSQSQVLHMHIPKNGKLSPEACDASLRETEVFFGRYFPEQTWQGVCCVTWLLDRELRHCLSADSNILDFASRFLPLARTDADGNQIIERVFGEGIDPLAVEPGNSLQTAVAAHLRVGGVFRTTGGFIPRGQTRHQAYRVH